MRNFYRLAVVLLAGVACNEALGIHRGKPRPDTSGSGGSAGFQGKGGSAADSGESSGGSDPTGGASAEAGETSGGSAGSGVGGDGAAGGGRGGSSGTSDPGGAGAGGGGSCSSQECRAQGFDLCLNGSCADITTPECNILLGTEWIEEHPEDEPFVFGAIGRYDFIDTYLPYWNLQLAMQEFSEHGALPIDGSLRRPVLLLCHGLRNSDPEPLRDSLDHLTETLGVSGIVSLLDPSELLPLVDRTLNDRDHDVFFLDFAGPTQSLLYFGDAPTGDSPLEGFLKGRVWHIMGDSSLVSLAYPPLVDLVEEHVNPGASAGQSARPTRLALALGSTHGFEVDLTQEPNSYVPSHLRINGALWRDQPANALTVDFMIGGAVEELAAFEADIVVDFSGMPTLAPLVDAAMRERGAQPPFYVLSPQKYRLRELRDQIITDPTLRSRVIGLNYASAEDTRLYDAYLERLQALTPQTLDVESSENMYDAVYFLIYATVAGGPGGINMSEGMARLIVGPRRDIGPSAIQSVLDRLLLNPTATLALYGPMGPPDFHRPTGGRIGYANAWCIDENLGLAGDVLRYDPSTDALLGTLPCFDF